MSEEYLDNLSRFYDIIHQDKDYKTECDVILKNVNTFNKLLDVGCGTLNHSLILSEKFKKIVGVDLSQSMLSVGKKKMLEKKLHNIELTTKDLGDIEGNFEVVISMFNVVNHIHSLKDLIDFFSNINDKLIPGGIFIFDCWNGTACRLEIPKKHKKKTVNYDWYTLILETKTETDLFNSISEMNNNVIVYSENEQVENFEYKLQQKLWTPDVFISILEMFNFQINKILPFFKEDKRASENDYRLTFIAQKK